VRSQTVGSLIPKRYFSDIKIILDFVPNHTSDQHEWFHKSANREKGYEDFYIWADGKIDEKGQRQPPNNWVIRKSFFISLINFNSFCCL